MKKAFTLSELLGVLAIIAILAALLVPVFAQAKAAAKASANLSNLKQTGLGHIQYSADNDDIFPLAVRYETPEGQAQAFGAPAVFATTPAGAIPWTEAIFPYTKNRDIYTSPLESAVTGAGALRQFAQAQYYGVMPSAAAMNVIRGSANTTYSLPGPYSQGAFVDGPFGYADGRTNTPISSPSRSQTSIERVAEVVLVGDAGAYDMGLLGLNPPTLGSNTAPTTFVGYAPGPWQGATVYTGPWGRKNTSGGWNGGKVNNFVVGQRGQTTFAATDGSAKSMDISKVYERRSIDGNANNVAVYRLYSSATQ